MHYFTTEKYINTAVSATLNCKKIVSFQIVKGHCVLSNFSCYKFIGCMFMPRYIFMLFLKRIRHELQYFPILIH